MDPICCDLSADIYTAYCDLLICLLLRSYFRIGFLLTHLYCISIIFLYS